MKPRPFRAIRVVSGDFVDRSTRISALASWFMSIYETKCTISFSSPRVFVTLNQSRRDGIFIDIVLPKKVSGAPQERNNAFVFIRYLR